MSLFRVIFLLILSLFSDIKGKAQIFSGNPASTDWNQINIPSCRIIFSKGLDSTATRIANVITFIKKPSEKTIGFKSKKINIILQDQTTVSNGYVALGPFRSEFYLTPEQNSFDMGSIPWPDQLALHEYRHVEQYSNFNVGFSRLMHSIFGEEGQALANDAAIPNWFYEGDAVYNETKFSNQGRGRLPSFFDAYRSLWKSGKNYPWMKLRNGSLKDFVPDYYALGYILVAYGYEKYGEDFWKNVTHDAASFKSLFYPFQHAIKKYSGLDYITFRNNAVNFFKKELNDEFHDKNSKWNKEAFHNELYPAFTENGAVIYVKSTFKHNPEFVLKTKNGKQKIRQLDYTTDQYFSYRNKKIVYTSFRPDIRWGYRNYSELQILDIYNGHQYTLSKNTRYFSPDISPNGKMVIVVNESPSGKSQLRLLNSESGRLVSDIPNPENLFYTYPKFYDTDKIVSAVRNPDGKMSLQEIDLETYQTRFLLPFSFNVIGFPFFHRDTLYFSCSFKTNDELFAYTFRDKKLWLISAPSLPGIGKYHAAINDSEIMWSTFTSDGYRIEKISKDSIEFIEINIDSLQHEPSNFGIVALNTSKDNLLPSVPNDKFTISKYHKGYRLFNFHSIEPAIDDPLYTLSAVSENILNTFQSKLSIIYDRSEKYKEFSFDATYGGWFPLLTTGINYLIDRNTTFRQKIIRYNQLEPYAGFHIPLNFSKGRSFTFLNLGSQYVYSSSSFKGKYKDTIGTLSYSYSSSFISFSHQIQKAPQQIYPSLAQNISISFKTPISNKRGYQFIANGNLYLPGIIQTHSLVFNGAFLKKDSLNQINFSSGFPFSRGYQAVNFPQMYKWGITYHLPLALPDAGFGNIIYLLRIRAGLFYDNTEIKDFNANHTPYYSSFRSTGIEINFDTKWWNEMPISFGIRYSRLLDKDVYGGKESNRWEIILPVNILNQ